MNIMLDSAPHKIHSLSEKYNHDIWQLRTPNYKNKLSGKPYGLDNGCFVRFDEKKWLKALSEAEINLPIFVTLPDIVGDARRTLDLFNVFKSITSGLPRALVLQDGIGKYEIPWSDIDAVFVGGTDSFKISSECINACKAAKMLNKWVHIGRVNTPERLIQWIDTCDSIDGTGLCKDENKLKRVIEVIQGSHKLLKQDSLIF